LFDIFFMIDARVSVTRIVEFGGNEMQVQYTLPLMSLSGAMLIMYSGFIETGVSPFR